jgi:hypothetical protein
MVIAAGLQGQCHMGGQRPHAGKATGGIKERAVKEREALCGAVVRDGHVRAGLQELGAIVPGQDRVIRGGRVHNAASGFGDAGIAASGEGLQQGGLTTAGTAGKGDVHEDRVMVDHAGGPFFQGYGLGKSAASGAISLPGTAP